MRTWGGGVTNCEVMTGVRLPRIQSSGFLANQDVFFLENLLPDHRNQLFHSLTTDERGENEISVLPRRNNQQRGA